MASAPAAQAPVVEAPAVQTASIDDLFDDFDPLDDFSPLTAHGEQPAPEIGMFSEPGLRTATGFGFDLPSGASGFDLEPPSSVPGLEFGFPEDGGSSPGEELTGMDVLDFIDDTLGTSRAGELADDVLDLVDEPPGVPPVVAAPAAPQPRAAQSPSVPPAVRAPRQEAALPPVVMPGQQVEKEESQGKGSRSAPNKRLVVVAALLVVVAGGAAWMFFGQGGSAPAPKPAPARPVPGGQAAAKDGAQPPATAEPAPAAEEAADGAMEGAPAAATPADATEQEAGEAAAAPAAAPDATNGAKDGAAEGAAEGAADDAAAPGEAADTSHLGRGRALEEAGQGREALAAYRAALDAGEGAPGEAHHRASVVHLSLGDGMRAQLEAKRAVGADPNSVEYRMQLGAAAQATGRGREALDAYREALALRPDDPMVQEALGTLLISMGAAREAIATLEPLVGGAGAPAVRLILGEAYLEVGAWSRAAAALQPVRDRDQAAYLLARAFLEQGQSAQALPYLARAVELEETEDVALRHLGYVYKELRRRREAVAAFRAYLERVPDAVDRAEIEDEIASLAR